MDDQFVTCDVAVSILNRHREKFLDRLRSRLLLLDVPEPYQAQFEEALEAVLRDLRAIDIAALLDRAST